MGDDVPSFIGDWFQYKLGTKPLPAKPTDEDEEVMRFAVKAWAAGRLSGAAPKQRDAEEAGDRAPAPQAKRRASEPAKPATPVKRGRQREPSPDDDDDSESESGPLAEVEGGPKGSLPSLGPLVYHRTLLMAAEDFPVPFKRAWAQQRQPIRNATKRYLQEKFPAYAGDDLVYFARAVPGIKTRAVFTVPRSHEKDYVSYLCGPRGVPGFRASQATSPAAGRREDESSHEDDSGAQRRSLRNGTSARVRDDGESSDEVEISTSSIHLLKRYLGSLAWNEQGQKEAALELLNYNTNRQQAHRVVVHAKEFNRSRGKHGPSVRHEDEEDYIAEARGRFPQLFAGASDAPAPGSAPKQPVPKASPIPDGPERRDGLRKVLDLLRDRLDSYKVKHSAKACAKLEDALKDRALSMKFVYLGKKWNTDNNRSPVLGHWIAKEDEDEFVAWLAGQFPQIFPGQDRGAWGAADAEDSDYESEEESESEMSVSLPAVPRIRRRSQRVRDLPESEEEDELEADGGERAVSEGASSKSGRGADEEETDGEEPGIKLELGDKAGLDPDAFPKIPERQRRVLLMLAEVELSLAQSQAVAQSSAHHVTKEPPSEPRDQIDGAIAKRTRSQTVVDKEILEPVRGFEA
ncbi:hypothetical protein DFJ74DRAFT_713001 [Hyaloraphidium curvatum]|nr:hypothetical protein DFJ74DRAFT_713001 [Hyaloraphidium curvatum]